MEIETEFEVMDKKKDKDDLSSEEEILIKWNGKDPFWVFNFTTNYVKVGGNIRIYMEDRELID